MSLRCAHHPVCGLVVSTLYCTYCPYCTLQAAMADSFWQLMPRMVNKDETHCDNPYSRRKAVRISNWKYSIVYVPHVVYLLLKRILYMIAVEEASKHASQVPLNICGARSPSLAHLQVEASLYQRAFLAMSHFHAHAQPLICVYSALPYLLYTSSVYIIDSSTIPVKE